MDKQTAKVVDNSVKGGISGASFGLGSSAVAATKVTAVTAGTTSVAMSALTASLALHPVGWAIGLGLAGATLYGYLAYLAYLVDES